MIRPRNAVLLGAEGPAPALAAAFAGLGRNLTLGAIEKALNAGPEAFGALLAQLEQWLLERRPLELIAGGAEPQPPSLVFPIDQAEELFNPDGAVEAAPFQPCDTDDGITGEPTLGHGRQSRGRSDRPGKTFRCLFVALRFAPVMAA